jgi:hypothetical protein
MPFNMEPPEIGQEPDVFNSLGVAGYGINNDNGMGGT